MKNALLGLGLILPFCALPLAVAPRAASAQIMSNPGQWYVNNQMYSTRVFNGVISNSLLRGGKKPGKATPSKSTAKKDAPASTTFRESPNHSLVKKLAKQVGGANPAEAEKAFRSFLDLYRQTARKDGFPANDLAYAFEYFVVNNYHLCNDLLDLPPDKDPQARRARDGFERITILSDKRLQQVSVFQERAIYNQFKQILSDSPEVRKMTDAQKQEAAELMAVMVGVNFATYMKGINGEDEATAEQARRMAREGLEKLLGVPAARVKITHRGLEL